jgi:hypothetical protein
MINASRNCCPEGISQQAMSLLLEAASALRDMLARRRQALVAAPASSNMLEMGAT